MKHLPNLPPDQLHFLSLVLGFFAIIDKIVTYNLSQNVMAEVTSLEVQFFYGFQLMMENIHNETYSLLINMYIMDKKKKMKYTMQLKQCPSLAPKRGQMG
jgi:ribonucleoside-diphosphate reductase beta chain